MKAARVIVVALSCAAIACALGACGSGTADPESAKGMERIRFEELSAMAEVRLDCPRERLDYEYLGDKIHLVEGCGRSVRYMIFQHGETWVKVESFHERAAFDLGCPAERLVATREDESTWRVTGCDKQVRFTLRCEADGVTCEWIAAD